MKPGDLILYTPDADSTESPDVGIVLKLSSSGTKASVLWSGESVGIFFAVGDLERYPENFKLVSK
tara:strand:+ start:345 stop:539 length:195 start_codon:yes stop_codon:yes gene_type:complete